MIACMPRNEAEVGSISIMYHPLKEQVHSYRKVCRDGINLPPPGSLSKKLAPKGKFFRAISEKFMRQIEKVLAQVCPRIWRHIL